MRILVTGATGFIGKHLVKELVKEHNVRCFVREKSKKSDINFLKNLHVEFFYGNIFNQEDLKNSLKNIDAFFHLAGGGNVATTFKSGFEELKKTNVGITESVIRAAVNSKIKKFIHFSSISAMGIQVEKKLNENTQCFPETPHEVFKYETEKIMEKYKDKILISIIRPGIVYGPYAMNSDFLQISTLLKKHFFIIPGNGKNLMPWVYVDEVIKATLLVFEKNKNSCEKFIIVSEPQATFNQLIKRIKKELGVKAIIIHIPKFSFRMMGYILEKLGNLFKFAPLINSVRARSMTSNRIYDISKLKELGYNPKNNFNESIKKTILWYKENGYI